jgi:hypothetical protein
MQNFKEVKLEIFVPQDHVMKLADALSEIGVGVIGNYDHCVALTPVRGFFRPRRARTHLKEKLERSTKWRSTNSKSIASEKW